MIVELIAAYGIIIGAIVGAGHALDHMYADLESNSSVETLSVFPNAEMMLEKNNIPIDTLSELEKEQSNLQSKTVVSDEPSNDDEGVKKQTSIMVVDEIMTESSITPASFVPPNSIEDGIKRNVESGPGISIVREEKSYDVFESLGFEDDTNIESWAK